MNKKTTLKLNRDFRRLYYKGSSAVHPLIVTYASKNRLGHNRIGITVTKKIGKAVCRNRCKRIIRAAFAQVNTQIEQGCCVCCADENAAGKIYRARTGPQKTNPEPYKTGQVQTKRQSSKSKGTITQKKSAQRAEGFRTQGSCKRTIRERQRMYYKEGKQREASAA